MASRGPTHGSESSARKDKDISKRVKRGLSIIKREAAKESRKSRKNKKQKG